ncbi:hypothetical protein CTheo_8604 [Ceratobasidium theobromae]|uniref:Uncharacterized protein n=1 Tax=Ceratobasidium theobromae TaxID=1582974 RepID=A0A5N5Q8X2_9AGAM|nr:hypothetical protein CTheo_8604 [Ceratobasidium theobromae]
MPAKNKQPQREAATMPPTGGSSTAAASDEMHMMASKYARQQVNILSQIHRDMHALLGNGAKWLQWKGVSLENKTLIMTNVCYLFPYLYHFENNWAAEELAKAALQHLCDNTKHKNKWLRMTISPDEEAQDEVAEDADRADGADRADSEGVEGAERVEGANSEGAEDDNIGEDQAYDNADQDSRVEAEVEAEGDGDDDDIEDYVCPITASESWKRKRVVDDSDEETSTKLIASSPPCLAACTAPPRPVAHSPSPVHQTTCTVPLHPAAQDHVSLVMKQPRNEQDLFSKSETNSCPSKKMRNNVKKLVQVIPALPGSDRVPDPSSKAKLKPGVKTTTAVPTPPALHQATLPPTSKAKPKDANPPAPALTNQKAKKGYGKAAQPAALATTTAKPKTTPKKVAPAPATANSAPVAQPNVKGKKAAAPVDKTPSTSCPWPKMHPIPLNTDCPLTQHGKKQLIEQSLNSPPPNE